MAAWPLSLRALERNLSLAFLTRLPRSLVTSWLVEEVSLLLLLLSHGVLSVSLGWAQKYTVIPAPWRWKQEHQVISAPGLVLGQRGLHESLPQNLKTNKQGITSWSRIFPNQAWLYFVYTSEGYIVLLFIGDASKTSSQMDVWNGRGLNHIHTFFLCTYELWWESLTYKLGTIRNIVIIETLNICIIIFCNKSIQCDFSLSVVYRTRPSG